MENRVRKWLSLSHRILLLDDGCMIWLGSKNDRGYGVISARNISRGQIYVHRLSLEVKIGRPMLSGEFALHSCHKPACVNPEHLRAGTPKDNMEDMNRAGRNKARKLSQDDIILIRQNKHESPRRIAERYGVSRTAIRNIIANKSYVIGET